MNPFYAVELYHDTETTCTLDVYDTLEPVRFYCERLYRQLRAMGAKGEIRVRYCHRGPTKKGAYQEEQVAFVNLNWYEFRYERT